MCRILTFLVCFVFLLGHVVDTAAADSTLVGWWKFDEMGGSTAADSSSTYSNGKLVGNPQWILESGRIDGALAFDGDGDYVDVGNPGALNFGKGDWSVCAWIKTTQTGTGDINKSTIFSNGGDGKNGVRYMLAVSETTAGRVTLTTDDNTTKVHATATTTVNDDVWHHVVGIRDGSALRVYVDCMLETTIPVPPGYDLSGTSQRNANIAAVVENEDGSMVKYFTGMIDDVRIYSHALNQDEVSMVYAGEFTGKIIDAEIARDPKKAVREAYENLQHLGNWRANPTIKKTHSDLIAGSLLTIVKVKETRELSIEEILDDYYHIFEQFPGARVAAEALSKIVILDKENGLKYASTFLEEGTSKDKSVVFYGTIIKNYANESDYENVQKYVKLSIDKYISDKDGPKLIVQLINNIGRPEECEKLYKIIIEQSASQNPNGQVCYAIFRHLALELSRGKNSDQLLELSKWILAQFPGTRLATYAKAALADEQYRQGNYVLAVLTFKPKLFTGNRSGSKINEDIDSTLTLYRVNTTRSQDIDLDKIYEALAEHANGLGRNAVAVHCYRQSTKAKGFSTDAFERAASKSVKYCNTGPENEIWFWKGLIAAEEGDLTTAAMAYVRFLKRDNTSILAARAYYDIAKMRMALGRDAEEQIMKAKAISPCDSVIRLERELNDSHTSQG